ncbi:uncharacterized protein LOC144714581 [Wolffia australiana]
MGSMNFRSLDEFWAFYVGQHSKPATRRLHCAGTMVALLCLLLFPLVSRWLLLAGPVAGYAIAWYSHFFVEGNVPATFGHPLWSLLCDLRMFFLVLTGQMDKEIKRLGKRPVLQAF